MDVWLLYKWTDAANEYKTGVVRLEAQLPDTSTVIARFLLQMHNKSMLYREMKVKVMEYPQ